MDEPCGTGLLVAGARFFGRLVLRQTVGLLDQAGLLLHALGLRELRAAAAGGRAHRPVRVLPAELGHARDVLVGHRVLVTDARIGRPEQQLPGTERDILLMVLSHRSSCFSFFYQKLEILQSGAGDEHFFLLSFASVINERHSGAVLATPLHRPAAIFPLFYF